MFCNKSIYQVDFIDVRVPHNRFKINDSKMAESAPGDGQGEGSLIVRICYELFGSPLNLALLGICGFLIYKIIASRRPTGPTVAKEPELPPLKKQDFTLEQLREYDGKGSDGRVLIAVNGKVFDVTRGKRFYGPGIGLHI